MEDAIRRPSGALYHAQTFVLAERAWSEEMEDFRTADWPNSQNQGSRDPQPCVDAVGAGLQSAARN